MQHKKSSSIIFLCILLIPLLSVGLIPSVKGAEGVVGKTITWDWLNIQLNQDPSRGFFQVQGGISTFGFTNFGLIGKDGDQYVYEAEALFGFDIYSFLAHDLREYYPNWEYVEKSGTLAHVDWVYITIRDDYNVKFHYNDITLGTLVPNTYRENIPITININPTWSALNGKIINGITIISAVQEYEVRSAEVVGSGWGWCGESKDNYTNVDPQSFALVARKVSNDSPSATRIVEKINTHNLNATTDFSDHCIATNITLQRSYAYADGVGTPYTNPGTNALTLTTNYFLQSAITYTRQTIYYRYAKYYHDKFWGTCSTPEGPTDKQVDRIISVQLWQPYVYQRFEVKVRFLSVVALDLETHDGISLPPDLNQGDWLWDPRFHEGEQTMDVEKSGLEKLWDWFLGLFGGFWTIIIWIIIIAIVIICIYLFIKLGVPLLQNRVERKHKKIKNKG